MRKAKKAVVFMFISLLTIQPLFAQDKAMNQNNLALTLLSTFVIGNIVAWSMGAYPRDFPIKPYSNEDLQTIQDLNLEIEENPGEADMKLELGELYFKHNDLDKAGDILSSAKENAPQNGSVLAVLSANQAKQSGAMWDFTWGIRKLNLMSDAVDGLNRAVKLEPANFMTRIYRINTLMGLENRQGSFHRIFEDEGWFQEKMQKDPGFFPKGVKSEFYRAMSEAYKANARQVDSEEEKQESQKKAEEYSDLSNTLKN